MAAVMVMAGCSKKTSVEETTTATATESDAAAKSYGTITLGEYKGVQVAKQTVEVTDEEVEARIQSIIAANPNFEEITDRAAQDGDTVNIDYVGKKDGTAFEGGTAQAFDLTLGSNSFIEGFEEGLVGAKVGDSLNLDLKFPAEYQNAELAGADVVFEVKINSIKVEKAAELNDEFVSKVSQYKTVDEFKAGNKDEMLKDMQAQADQQKQYEAIMAVANNSEIVCDETAVEEQFNEQMNYYTSMVESYGMKLEDYVAMFGMDVDTFKAQIRTSSEDSVKQKLVIDAVAEKEGFKIEDADRDALAKLYDTDAATLVTQYGQESVDENAKMMKVFTFLADNAVEVESLPETLPETAPNETESSEAAAVETTKAAN